MTALFPLGGLGLRKPPGWTATTVGAFCSESSGEVQTGPFGSQLHASDYSAEGTPVVMPQDLIDGLISVDKIARVNADHVGRLSRHQLQRGDVVYSRRGDVTRFAVVRAEEAGWLCGTGCLRIRLNSTDIDIGYLRWFLSHGSVRDWLIRQAKGATMPNLNTGILEALPIFYPPLPEQRRIAAILDKADAIRRKRQETIRLTEEFLRSAFLDMFGDPVTNPKGWPSGTIEEVVVNPKSDVRCGPFGTQLKVQELVSTGVPLLGIENVRDDRFVPDTSKFLTPAKAKDLGRFDVHPGDVLVTRMGTIGRACVVPPHSPSEARISYHLFRIRPDHSRCLPGFLAATIAKSGTFMAQLKRLARGAIMDGLTTSNLKEVQFLLPPIQQQERYLQIVSKTDALLGRLNATLEFSDHGFNSLVQDAFQGRLSRGS
jgi:type I restriction enzyme S subunit